ncbi:hypothetical protein NpNSSI1_00005015 [Neofusicoccum parvum]|nr:hypothetical protein NpNSSI1_00005015 [Neofusicoccum parvum]
MSSIPSLPTPPETPPETPPSSQAGNNETMLADDPYPPGSKEPCVASSTKRVNQMVDKPNMQQSGQQQQQQATQWPVVQQPVQPPQAFQSYVLGCQCPQCYQPTFNPGPHAAFSQPAAGGYNYLAPPQPPWQPPLQPPFQPPVFTGPPPSQPQPQAGPSGGPLHYPHPPPRRRRPDRHRGMDGKALDDEDYDRRKVGKLCFYCGQDDHFVRDCPEEHRKHERKRREWILVTGEEPVEKDLARAAAKAKAKYRGRLMQGAPGV